MLVETDGHTVPHFKAPVYAKMELWGPECGGTFSIQTILLNISHLLHKMSFVWFVLSTTVIHTIGKMAVCIFHESCDYIA